MDKVAVLAELIQMVKRLRVKELRELSEFLGLVKYGNRSTLLERCLLAMEAKKDKIPGLASTIRELHLERSKNGAIQPLGTIPAVAAPPKSHDEGSPPAPINNNSGNNGNGARDPSSMPVTSKAVDNAGTGPRRTFTSPLDSKLVLNGCSTGAALTSTIKLIKLPFFEIKAVVLEPTVLGPVNQNGTEMELASCRQSFRVTQKHFDELNSSFKRQTASGRNNPVNLQLQIRFCAVDPAAAEQVDMLPRKLEVKTNGFPVPLPMFLPTTTPKVEPMRQPIPIRIPTFYLVPKTDNIISVEWERVVNGRDYAMTVLFVRVLNALDLFKRLKRQPREVTKEQVKKITSASQDGITAPKLVSVSLICPLGKTRMKYPCRAKTCRHLQCFDAEKFLLMNELKPKFKCPVCNDKLIFDDLIIDMYHVEILCRLHEDEQVETVEMYPDGTFKLVVEGKKGDGTVATLKRKRMNGDVLKTGVTQSASESKIVCIDLFDEEDGASK